MSENTLSDILYKGQARKIQLKIRAGETMCENCEHKGFHSTGLIGEWHAKCLIFGTAGKWREHDMKRDKRCIQAEKNATKSATSRR